MLKWIDELWLLTPEEFDQLPDGTELLSINHEIKTKGVGYIDRDVRYGHMAYGVVGIENHPLKNLLLTFILKGNKG